MKLAFVVQRYGREILGGSETLARQLAERLSRRHEIEVLTTTAKDYITWKNEYEAGEEKLRGVKIHRFPVEGERDLEEFNKFSEEIYKGQSSREQELEWLEKQGPVVPELVEYLKKEQERFDLIIFFTYLYYPTFYGLKVAPEKSVLVPTAHDEPPLKLGIFKEMFQLPNAFLFNTEAEELLVLDRFPVHKKMRETIGMGMELLDQPDPSAFRKKHDIPGKYLIYAGRIDAGKGMDELLRYFTFYKEEHPESGNLQLVLIGKLGMKLPEDKSVRYIGFVDEADKLSAMAGAVAVVQPSRMESLSIVTLEAFSVGSPVLANAHSQVLVDHCRRSNAGFYYRDFEEFEELLHLLLGDKSLGRELGKNGQRYIKEKYGWSKLLSKYELTFRSAARPAKEPRIARRPVPPPSPTPAREKSAEAEEPPGEPSPETASVAEPETSEAPESAARVEQEQGPPPEVAVLESGRAPSSPENESAGAEPSSSTEAEEPENVPEELEHLPSFYRAAIPPTPPLPTTPPGEDEPGADEPTEPEARESTEPEARESTEPEAPKSTEPEARESTEPEARESTEPEARESTEPSDDGREEKDTTETASEKDQEEGLPEFFRPRPLESSSNEATSQGDDGGSESDNTRDKAPG